MKSRRGSTLQILRGIWTFTQNFTYLSSYELQPQSEIEACGLKVSNAFQRGRLLSPFRFRFVAISRGEKIDCFEPASDGY